MKKRLHNRTQIFILLIITSVFPMPIISMPNFLTFPNPLKSSLLHRFPRYASNRYDITRPSISSSLSAINKPENGEAQDANRPNNAALEKRCTRCDSPYYNSGRPYEDRRYRDRPEFSDRRYYEHNDDPHYNRYEDRSSYDRWDRKPFYRKFDRFDKDGDDRERYDRYSDRDRSYYDRDYERGYGYDNRGYDYRDRVGLDDNSRDKSEYLSNRPENGYWNGGSGAGYASGWNYERGRDDNRDRYGVSGGNTWYNRPKESSYDSYRGTSYLYARPTSTTTTPDLSVSNSGTTNSAIDLKSV